MTTGTSPVGTGFRLASRYVLGAEIARGVTCTVFHAQDDQLHRAVAIRIVKPEWQSAYHRSLETAFAFSHPVAVCAIDAVEHGGALFVVQELIAPARPLVEEIQRGIPLDSGLSIVAQLSQAIAYAHSYAVPHGDLTPSAVLVDRLMQPHLNNFAMPPDDDYFTKTTAAMRADPALQGITVADHTASMRGDIVAMGQLLWGMLGEKPSGQVPGLRRDIPDDVRELMRHAAAGDLDAVGLARELALLSASSNAYANLGNDAIPPAVLANRAIGSQLATWSTQPTVAARPSVASGAMMTLNAISQEPLRAGGDSCGTRIIPPLSGEPVGDHSRDETILLHREPTSIEERPGVGGLSTGMVVILCLILFVLFFLVGFYSIVLTN